MSNYVKLGDICYITKLAGFEHTKYIQGNCSHEKKENFIPLFIGKTVRNGKIDDNFDWYISSEISEQLPRSQLTKRCLVMPYVGSIGDVAIFDGNYKAHLGSNIAKIELNSDKFILDFIYYYLKSDLGQAYLFKDVQGAVQKNITMSSIRDVKIPVISIDKQKRIVNYLKPLDEQISTSEAAINLINNIISTIYEYWFIQFKYPDSNDDLVYNDKLHFNIPNGWKSQKLGDCIKSINTGLNPRDNFVFNTNGKYKYITVKNLNVDGSINYSGCDIIDDDAYKIVHKRSNIAKGDILYASIAPLGRAYYIIEKPDNWDINESVFSIRPNDSINSEYLYSLLTSKYFIEKTTNNSTGSIFNGIRVKTLSNLQIIVPDKETLNKYHEFSYPLFQRKYYYQNLIEKCLDIKKYLLPLLMNGQVTINE